MGLAHLKSYGTCMLAVMNAEAIAVDEGARAARHDTSPRGLASEAPNLVPLFRALRGLPAFPESGEPAQRLKRFLIWRGVSPACWRIVAKSPARLWMRYLRFCSAPAGEAAVDVIRLIDLVHADDAPPRWFLDRLFTLRASEERPGSDFAGRFAGQAHALRRLAHLIERSEHPRMRAELRGILLWIEHCGDLVSPTTVRRCDWAFFVRRAAEWRHLDRARVERRTTRWWIPFERAACGPYEAIVLGDAFELWQEGERLRHCAGSLDVLCAGGEALVVSLRDPARRRPVCTALYELREDRWFLTDVAGFANRKPEADVSGPLADIAAAFNAAPRATNRADTLCLDLCLDHLEAEMRTRHAFLWRDGTDERGLINTAIVS